MDLRFLGLRMTGMDLRFLGLRTRCYTDQAMVQTLKPHTAEYLLSWSSNSSPFADLGGTLPCPQQLTAEPLHTLTMYYI
jgi:hypothetical protein